MKTESHLKLIETENSTGACEGIHELIDWEILQYRKEVDAHRHDLSRVEGRCVAWQEAEKDFNTKDRVLMEEKWRTEYCGFICPLRSECLLAARLLQNSAERMSKAG